jgi:DNA-binding response OmpR family regulator
VLEAHDGRAALDLYRERAHEIDLVLLDLTMPRLSGDDALREMRVINPGVVVLLMSGYGAQLPAPIASEPFIQKPFRRADLLDRVDAMINR